MEIYISDIKNDNSHPRSTGIGELGDTIEEVFPEEYYEREDLEGLLIIMLKEIKSLRENNQALRDKIDMITEVNDLITEPIT